MGQNDPYFWNFRKSFPDRKAAIQTIRVLTNIFGKMAHDETNA